MGSRSLRAKLNPRYDVPPFLGMSLVPHISREHCVALDAKDSLRAFRTRFVLPPGTIYLDGNSLGVLPAATPARLQQVIAQEWGQRLIRSWNDAGSGEGWVDWPQRLGAKIGRLIGARPGETLVADSTSANLFKLLAMALQLRPERDTILVEAGDFPTDQYIAQGLTALLGGRHRLRRVAPETLEHSIDERTAVLLLSHVNYRTGAMHDLPRLTAAAHQAGALVLWDLAHSAGAVPLALADAGVDFAVGCGYKYLNGGPGAPAFLYIANGLQGVVRNPLSGWFGHAEPFSFLPDYAPAHGIARALCGTPPVLGLAALEVGVDLALEAPMAAVREKSLHQGELFVRLIVQELDGQGFELVTPRDIARRGSQVVLRHPEAWPISQALIARGVVGDFRAPDLLRFGFTPLYLGYAELWDAVAVLRRVMQEQAWQRPEHRRRAAVT